MQRVAQNSKGQEVIIASDKKFEDNPGEQLSYNNTTAWVAYQGCKIYRKGSAEDAHFMDQIPKDLLDSLKKLPEGIQKEIIAKTIKDTIEQMQEECKNYHTRENVTGTTLSAVFVFNNQAYVIGVGDSIAAKYNGKQLSEPIIKYHDQKNDAEVARVKAKGGQIFGGRISGLLAVFRSIGGTHVLEGITHEPEIKVIPFVKGEQLFLASDGLEKEITEKNTNQKMTGMQILETELKKSKDLKKTAGKFLASNADALRGMDDVSMMVVDSGKNGLYGICDGHGGKEVAYHVSKSFAPAFSNILRQNIQQRLIHTAAPTREPKIEKTSQEKINEDQLYKKENDHLQNETILMKSDIRKNAGEIFNNTLNYIQNMFEAYNQLHPAKGVKKGDVLKFIGECSEITDGTESNKLEKIFGILNKEIQKQMEIHGKNNIDDLAVFLNRNPNQHHFTRLLVILYDYLQKSAFDIDGKMHLEIKIDNGKPTIPSLILNSFFSKTDLKNGNNPYEEAKAFLKETPKVLPIKAL